MTPTFFASQMEFRRWLEENHKKESELIVGYYKVDSDKPSMTWSESVDQALCFGWIDGVRNSIDKESYQIRFTQRRPSSNWSAINIRKVEELTKKGLMQAAGLAIFEMRKENKSEMYSYENEEIKFPYVYEKQFKGNQRAWEYFQSLAPSYKKTSTKWVMSAKQETTQIKRLQELITECAAGTNRWKDNRYNKK
jgi:uncharacterized protein YdeI (YjbR/CyaY-like superfamily)